MHEEISQAYNAAHSAAAGGVGFDLIRTQKFQAFLQAEEVEIDHEVALMMNEGIIKEDQVDRWRDRVGLVRMVEQMIRTWKGVCGWCGNSIPTAAESSNQTRTICQACAAKQKPVPSAAELFNLITDIFPEHAIHGGIITAWSDDQRRTVGHWLDLILTNKTLPGQEPAFLRPMGKEFGLSSYGPYFPSTPVEIGEGGVIPSSDKAHDITDASQLPADGRVDITKGGDVETERPYPC